MGMNPDLQDVGDHVDVDLEPVAPNHVRTGGNVVDPLGPQTLNDLGAGYGLTEKDVRREHHVELTPPHLG